MSKPEDWVWMAHDAPAMDATMMKTWLDKGCSNPSCTSPKGHPLFLNQSCHPGAPVKVRIHADGYAVVHCAICAAPFVSLALAGGDTVPDTDDNHRTGGGLDA